MVGAGPAGLTASFYLALLGHEVAVHESHAEPGGMLRFALPEYRLPRNVLDREIEIIRRLGVQFVLNSRIGADIALSDLEEKFDAVFLSLGTWKETQVRIPATIWAASSARCISSKARPTTSGRTSVSGSSSSAAATPPSTARARRSARGRPRPSIYRRERKDMPAIAEEVDAAEEEGVSFLFLASPHRIVGERGAVKAIEVTKTRLGAFDTSGRRRPIDTGEVQASVATALSWRWVKASDSEFCEASGLATKSGGMLESIATT